MLTGTSSSTTSSTSAIGADTTKAKGGSNMDAAQDRFLKLLVAQLNNQDPMNPLDNAQMTSQMAQINTVTGIQQVNDTLKSMAAQFSTLQVMQGANMIGHDVLIDGNTLSLVDGQAQGAVDLAARAESVKIDVFSPGGQRVDTINLGALDAGRSHFTWRPDGINFSGPATFKISASSDGKAIDAQPLTRASVQSVSSEGGTMMIQLNGRSPVSYSSVKAIL